MTDRLDDDVQDGLESEPREGYFVRVLGCPHCGGWLKLHYCRSNNSLMYVCELNGRSQEYGGRRAQPQIFFPDVDKYSLEEYVP